MIIVQFFRELASLFYSLIGYVYSVPQQNYNKLMMDLKKRMNSQYNTKIIRLIRQKINPLHGSKKHNFKRLFANTFHKSSSKSFLQVQGYDKQNDLQKTTMDKVRSWFSLNKMNGESCFKQSNFQQFIEIFRQTSQKSSLSRTVSDDLKVASNTYDYKKQLSLKLTSLSQTAQLQQRRLINAKIRKKINHRKIINLQRKHAV